MTRIDKLYKIYLKSFSSGWVLWDPDESIGHSVVAELSVALGKLDRDNNRLVNRDEFVSLLENEYDIDVRS